jgi:predicted permease
MKLPPWFRRARWERDLAEEMNAHLEERTAELVRQSLAPAEASARARREFGNLASLAEQSRDVWRWALADELWRAFAHAARALGRGGAYTVVSIVTLALGIGVNAALFNITDAVLLRPLPYEHPERLVRTGLKRALTNEATAAATPEFVAWRNENHTFAGLIAWNQQEPTLTGAGEPERLVAATVSADFLRVLGLHTSLGRDFTKEDDRPGVARVALITDSLWRRHWNGDPSVLGQPMFLDDAPVAIAGVLPPDFLFPGDLHPDILLPAQFGGHPQWSAPTMGILTVVGRLNPGIPAAEAAADLDRIVVAHKSDEPAFLAPTINQNSHVSMVPLQTSMAGDVRPALLLLVCAAGFVLLIACANVANLQLSRFHGRVRELRVRAALGATSAQLLRLALAECLLLSAAGAALGLAAPIFW